MGIPYDQTTLSAAGGTGTYQWSVTGTFPAGLKLAQTTGVISGTPKTASPKTIPTFTVWASDGIGTASRQFSVKINPALSISTKSLADGEVGADYSQPVAATGGSGTYNWTIASGDLPPGLEFADGSISGSPTIDKSYTFTVRVEDDFGAVAKSLSMTVYPTLTITTDLLPAGQVKVNYSQTLAADGGKGPYTWSVISGNLPGGLKLDANVGAITGKPNKAGIYTFTIKLTDSLKLFITKELSVQIN